MVARAVSSKKVSSTLKAVAKDAERKRIDEARSNNLLRYASRPYIA